jgi:Pvc16 N-terminal domain/Carboxypeptidase regulatory-like domain
MFRDLDDTLTSVLDDPMAPSELVAADVNFEIPDETFNPAQPTVNLFLYDVHENRELRDPVPIVENIGGVFVRRRPPLRVDCSYQVTAWDNATGATRVANEHRLLSQALQWLSRIPIIPDVYLRGRLVNPPFPHRTEVALMDGGKSLGEFWTALKRPPKPSFNLLVTIAMELGVEMPEGPPVITKDMRLLQKDKPATQQRWIEIGGTVSAAVSPPNAINGAQVLLVERNQTAVTDEQGHFTFTLLLAGNYTLEVSKAGFTTATKSITVPGANPDAYDVILAP